MPLILTGNTFSNNHGPGAWTSKSTAAMDNTFSNTFTNNSAKWRGGGFCVKLTEPAAVTLQIHAVDGSLIRTLSLGHKTVGTYQTRSRAAYWDGKNEVGEPVASGVYFYTLAAGNFTATRKMLIRK